MPTTLLEPTVQRVSIAGSWRDGIAVDTFNAYNPRTGEQLSDSFPISGWADIDAALASAAQASTSISQIPDAGDRIAAFLSAYAGEIERNADALVAAAAEETGLAASPRLRDIELPRTTGQLRQAAAAAKAGDWQRPIIDTKAGLRSKLSSIGPVLVIGPNNFPFAFNGISGGDFAAAIAAGNPVIAKGHPLHPTTSRLLAESAITAATSAGLPAGFVQMLYHFDPDDGLRMVADPRLKAIAFTGSRAAGMAIKAAADAAGKPFFGEMSSLNPLVLLPGALVENLDGIADQFVASILMGTGQFCTKPGLTLLLAGPKTAEFASKVEAKLRAAPAGPLFSASGRDGLLRSIDTLQEAGATLIAGGTRADGDAFSVNNTLLCATAKRVLQQPEGLQTEAFGNAALLIVADDLKQTLAVLAAMEGNLTGTIYSAADGSDDAAYTAVAAVLRPKVGRLINDKMPTGVAVSPAMNHGGPFPATNQPHFSAVGIPGSIGRFTQLECFDNVRPHRLPACLRDRNPTGQLWRQIDGRWTTDSI